MDWGSFAFGALATMFALIVGVPTTALIREIKSERERKALALERRFVDLGSDITTMMHHYKYLHPRIQALEAAAKKTGRKR